MILASNMILCGAFLALQDAVQMSIQLVWELHQAHFIIKRKDTDLVNFKSSPSVTNTTLASSPTL